MKKLLFLALVMILANFVFAQDAPQSEVPVAQVPAPVCPYQVNEKDNVYFQITGYNLKPKSVNLTLLPYFRLYEQVAEKAPALVRQTYAHAGTQHEKAIAKPSNYQIWLEDNKTYSIDMLSDWGNEIVCKGTINFPSNPLIVWAKNPANNGKKYHLSVSKGNSVELEFKFEKKGFYYFEIAGYDFDTIDETFYEFLEKNYYTKITVNENNKNLLTKPIGTGSLNVTFTQPKELEFLLPYKTRVYCEFTIQNKMGILCTIKVKVDDIFKSLSEAMNANPTNCSMWIVPVKDDNGNDIILKFAGIQRLYMLKNVTIPTNNSIHVLPRYANNAATPCFRVYLDENGKSLGKTDADKKVWLLDFPQKSDNKFEVREGTGATYTIHIKDIDTWFQETHILDIGDLKDLDLKRVIIEDVGSMGNPGCAAKVRFQLL